MIDRINTTCFQEDLADVIERWLGVRPDSQFVTELFELIRSECNFDIEQQDALLCHNS